MTDIIGDSENYQDSDAGYLSVRMKIFYASVLCIWLFLVWTLNSAFKILNSVCVHWLSSLLSAATADRRKN